MESRKRLKNLIEQDSIAFFPGVHDALCVKVANEFSFVDGFQHSGYGTAASLLGYPDLDFTSLAETTAVVRNMVRTAEDRPVIVDGDTGYGGIANLKHTISEIENTGAAGIFIEDQEEPKQCGLIEGKNLVSVETMAGKIEAARAARSDEDFVVMARTDAYDEHGIEEAIRRGEHFAEAGAEVFLLGDPVPLNEINRITDAIDIPFYALGVHTDDAEFDTWNPVEAYEDVGASLVSDVAGLLQVSVPAMESYLQALQNEQASSREVIGLNQLSNFLGVDKYTEFENSFSND